MTLHSKYFYGNEVSSYGLEHGYVDYRTLAKSFNHVLNNDIISELTAAGYYFESENEYYYADFSGNVYDSEEADDKKTELENEKTELENILESLDDNDSKIAELQEKIQDIENDLECLDDIQYKDIFQYYIVDDNGADILKEAGEIVYYCEKLDMYVWGVTHYGTSWDYVLTDIVIDLDNE